MPQKTESFSIKDWDAYDRPREKLKTQGASFLSNAELFAVLIGSGTVNQSVVGLMKQILMSVNNDLQKFDQLALEHLMSFKGTGEAKVIKIKATLELSKRFQRHKPNQLKVLNFSKTAYEVVSSDLEALSHEEFWILYLNQSKSFN